MCFFIGRLPAICEVLCTEGVQDSLPDFSITAISTCQPLVEIKWTHEEIVIDFLLMSRLFVTRSESAVIGFFYKVFLVLYVSRFIFQDPGKFIEATVENIVPYGAFFALEDGCSGFVHISQVNHGQGRLR